MMGRKELSYGRESKKNRTRISLMDREISINSTTMAKKQETDLIHVVSTERSNMKNSINNRNTVEQWEQLMRLSRVNHMECFTCRNCSLLDLTFLQQFTELTYIDVSTNLISSLEPSKKSFQFLKKLILTNNHITNLNFARIIIAWPALEILQIDDNPMTCSYMSHMKNRASNLNRTFQLRIDKKCKNTTNKIIS
jgi:Leucine-rich repeat (LRR) protein